MKRKKIGITDKKAVENLCNIATELYKLEKGSLGFRSRKQNLQLPRMAVSNIARIEKGIHYEIIGEVLKRDRCSIYHYEAQHKILYETWSKYRDIFNNIYNAYSNGKKKNLSERQLLNILKAAGIKNVEAPKVFIDVVVSGVEVRVDSDYRNFTETVELIKSSLETYVHDIRIEI
jgi:hypothetical protein